MADESDGQESQVLLTLALVACESDEKTLHAVVEVVAAHPALGKVLREIADDLDTLYRREIARRN